MNSISSRTKIGMLLLLLGGAALLASSDYSQFSAISDGEKQLQMMNPIASKTAETTQMNDKTCYGNAADTCDVLPAADFYPSGSEDALNPAFNSGVNDDRREIAGDITQVSGNTVTLKTTSGRVFRVKFPIDAVTWFNENRLANYPGLPAVGVGSTLAVMYGQPTGHASTTLEPNQLISSQLKLGASFMPKK